MFRCGTLTCLFWLFKIPTVALQGVSLKSVPGWDLHADGDANSGSHFVSMTHTLDRTCTWKVSWTQPLKDLKIKLYEQLLPWHGNTSRGQHSVIVRVDCDKRSLPWASPALCALLVLAVNHRRNLLYSCGSLLLSVLLLLLLLWLSATPLALCFSCTLVFLLWPGGDHPVWLHSAALLPAAESALPSGKKKPLLCLFVERLINLHLAPRVSVDCVISTLPNRLFLLIKLFAALLFALIKVLWHYVKLEERVMNIFADSVVFCPQVAHTWPMCIGHL